MTDGPDLGAAQERSAHVRRKPSEYVREHVRFTTQPLEDVNVEMYREYLD